ncbi:hypothetical protein N0V94_008936 [Neodidymelliopsis sp. IMI 364377]|nr:hypothetical protein N0V94_008936 [Neodidymelliopsis sp. IMI 364377]
MPPPRLPRHLWPCRPLWSARQVCQVRFASDRPSDKPPNDSGDARESARPSPAAAGGAAAVRGTEATVTATAPAATASTPASTPAPAPTPTASIRRKVTQDRIGPNHNDAAIASHLKKKKMAELGKSVRQPVQELEGTARRESGKKKDTKKRIKRRSSSLQPTPNTPLLEELFPEVTYQVQPAPTQRRDSYPKLDLPASDAVPHFRLTLSDTRTDREKAIDAFQRSSEPITVLQLSHCSTELTEADFRRLMPKGLHIEAWAREGEFYKIIPGRDPLSLERLPFYYLLFRSPASALAYQKNASRLSKLSALHQPSSIQSAIPPPRGFLEDGEDLHTVSNSFVLHPTGHALDLRTVMQPYNHALRALIDQGGYTPIVSGEQGKDKTVHRVLVHINGYEPSHADLWMAFLRHAHAHGIIWPFVNSHSSAVRRLRDMVNLRTVPKNQTTSTSNPRAASSSSSAAASAVAVYEDPHIAAFLGTSDASAEGPGENAAQMNQLVMNRLYNRWIVEFEDETAARRFAIMWHRVLLPERKEGVGRWREGEEERWVSAEYLW